MSSRRSLKKTISYILNDFILASLYPNINRDAIMQSIANVVNLIPRISHTEPGNAKAYYKQLRNELNAEIDKVVEEYKKAIKE